MDQYWAGDVIVVGAGAAGLLVAGRLADDGLSVTVIESQNIGSGQSNHSHGYMHRGHIYLSPSAELVARLGEGADRWASILSGETDPVTTSSSLVFTNAYEAEVAEKAWSENGLKFDRSTSPAGLRDSAFARAFTTDEVTYDFTNWLAAASTELGGRASVGFINGEVQSLEREAGSISGVVVNRGDVAVRLSASYVVLCAGIDNLRLASTVTRFRGNGMNRTSLMLVVQGPDLPPLSVVAHGHETRGLFLVSRRVGAKSYWLVSNYVSFAGETISDAAAHLWLRDIRATLLARTTALDDPSVTWGYYAAPKGELRSMTNKMDIHTVQSYGLKNLAVSSPTKLTLAPLLADTVSERIRLKLRNGPRPAKFDEVVHDPFPPPVSGEMWTSVDLQPITSLMAH